MGGSGDFGGGGGGWVVVILYLILFALLFCSYPHDVFIFLMLLGVMDNKLVDGGWWIICRLIICIPFWETLKLSIPPELTLCPLAKYMMKELDRDEYQGNSRVT